MDEAFVNRYDVSGPRYTSYPTVPVWSREFGAADRASALGRCRVGQGIGMYVHIPFCERRCAYCGCNVVIARDRDRAELYIDRVLQELEDTLPLLPSEPVTIKAMHLGGGTPTFLRPMQLQRLVKGLMKPFERAPGAEFALEAEPTVTSEAHLEVLAELGFNRISFGVQDFDPQVLKIVSRARADDALPRLVETSRRLGFKSVNFDLIYGLPGQRPGRWYQSIQQVLALRPDRAAIYSFAFLPDLRTHQRPLARHPRPVGLEKVGLFAEAYEAMCSEGYVPVGMDHFALPTDDLAMAQREGRLGRNFQGYSTQWNMDILGFGVSAISDVGGAFLQNPSTLREYGRMVDARKLEPERGWKRTQDDERRRRIIQGLMCNFSAPLLLGDVQALASELEVLTRPQFADLVHVGFDRLDLTNLGRIFVRNVAMVFDAYLQGQPAQQFSRTV
ncbi:MAG: oxygen-independent coproporphyrinogen III oxidase [Myxococcota bacterium]